MSAGIAVLLFSSLMRLDAAVVDAQPCAGMSVINPGQLASSTACVSTLDSDAPKLILVAKPDRDGKPGRGNNKDNTDTSGDDTDTSGDGTDTSTDTSDDTTTDTSDDTTDSGTDSDTTDPTAALCQAGGSYLPEDFDNVIEDFEQTTTLRLDGPEWNNTLVRNCNIHSVDGPGIFIRNVTNVVVANCQISNVTGAGIKLSSTGSTQDVVLDGNVIQDVGGNGISSAQRSADGVDHRGTEILNNTVHNTGSKGSSGKYHGIYVQGQDTTLIKNTVSGQRDGNGISIRSSGVVRCNTVEGVSTVSKPAIRYFSDHQKGPSDQLLIEHNDLTNDSIGIHLHNPVDRYDGQPPRAHVVKNFVIQYNTINAAENVRIDDEYGDPEFTVDEHDNQ